ncbi:MAG: hypothetical protein JWO06_604 [Bacteroidota bacterium]|nr:hypothetical protein [Bacteroidota bacterium]
MKRLFTTLFLACLILFGSSFKKHRGHVEHYKNEGYLMAVIDGRVFETREENKYTAELKNKSGDLFASANATPLTKVTTSVNFFGTDFKDDDNNVFTESLGFEYTFAENNSMGEPTGQRISLDYNNAKYYNVPGETALKVTKMEWSSDHRYFIMSADFECKMRKWGVPASTQPIVKVKGRVENINVTVPAWIVLKSPTQVAQGGQ